VSYNRNSEKEQDGALKKYLNKLEGDAKKEGKKQAWKFVLKKFIAAAMPIIMMLLKILLVVTLATVLITVIACAINNLFGGNDGADSEEKISFVSIRETEITEENLENFIDEYQTENTEVKENLKANKASIIALQKETGYSSYFFATLVFEEEISKDNYDKFFEETKIKLRKWQLNGYTTAYEIAQEYLIKEETNEKPKQKYVKEWASNIEKKIKETREKM